MTVEAAAADCETVVARVGDRVDRVATIELSRPDTRNALNGQLRSELKTVLDAVEDSDVRIAHADATLGQPEINLGLIPGGGGTQRLPRLVGEGQAMRLILSGESIDAAEAADIGLVDAVHGDEDFDDAVYDLAASMAEKSPIALEYANRSIQAASRMDIEAGIEYEAELFAQLFATADPQEGIDAFLEDREPDWPTG